MAAAGAALATVASQGISVIVCVYKIRRNGLPFSFRMKNIRVNKSIISRIVRLGSPIALQDLLVSISFLVIAAIVNSLGLIPSAGVGVAEKLCIFIMLVPSSYMQSMSAFVAQNIGAGKNGRAKKAMAYGMATSLIAGLFMGYLAFFHGDILAAAFAKDPRVISAAADYLKAYAIDTLSVSFLFCYMGYFNGCGKTTFVMAQGIIGAFLVRIPVSYLMSHVKPVRLFYVGLATPASTLLQITLCTVYFIIINRKPIILPEEFKE
jgi:Na+-driven multidrug efflux pump